MQKEITIVCCYNKIDEFNRLVEDINNQDIKCDIIGLDNRDNKYKSCANAYNIATKDIKTKYVLYSHQDIDLVYKDTISKLVNYIKRINTYDILGVAGAYGDNDRLSLISNIRTKDGSEYAIPNKLSNDLQEVQTVDECIFGGYTECFKKYPFDDDLCDNYHLYAVEISLRAIIRGDKVFVCDIDLIHKSPGNADKRFFKGVYKLAKAYSNKIDYIYTTNAISSTAPFKREVYYIKQLIKLFINRGKHNER